MLFDVVLAFAFSADFAGLESEVSDDDFEDSVEVFDLVDGLLSVA